MNLTTFEPLQNDTDNDTVNYQENPDFDNSIDQGDQTVIDNSVEGEDVNIRDSVTANFRYQVDKNN